MSKLIVRGVNSSADEERLRELATQAFNFPDASWETFVTIVERHNLRVAETDQGVVGGMSYYPVGQWFAGKCLPMAAFALVLMAPEHRGHGYALEMLKFVMKTLRAQGVPLVTLYPSTQEFYRKLGFEQAGNSYDYLAAVKDINPGSPQRPMRRVDPAEHMDVLQSLATQAARRSNGCLDRNPGMWKRIYIERSGKVFAYLVGPPGEESGYLIYEQTRHPGRLSSGALEWEQRVFSVRDMVGLDAETIQSLWAFIYGNRTVTEVVTWTGPATDPRGLLTSEYEAKIIRPRRWMLRVLDVPQALLGRGYPDCNAELVFRLEDPLIPENQGVHGLRIRHGVPELLDAGDAQPMLTMHVKDFGPLFSGLLTAEQLREIGKLRCEDDKLVARASQVFSTSEPWMADSF